MAAKKKRIWTRPDVRPADGIPGYQQIASYQSSGDNETTIFFKSGKYYLALWDGKMVEASEAEALRDWVKWTAPARFKKLLTMGINALVELGVVS